MALIKWPTLQNPFYFSKIMMNILPRNPADSEAKSPCDKNIRYSVCAPGHDSPNGTTFFIIVVPVYDKQKTALRDCLSEPETIYSCDQVTWIIHSGSFLIITSCGNQNANFYWLVISVQHGDSSNILQYLALLGSGVPPPVYWYKS
jgi:hypothetical protein